MAYPIQSHRYQVRVKEMVHKKLFKNKDTYVSWNSPLSNR